MLAELSWAQLRNKQITCVKNELYLILNSLQGRNTKIFLFVFGANEDFA